MAEYTFDASLTVEAETEEAAADLILEHCMDGVDIAAFLCKEGTLNVKTALAENERKDAALDVVDYALTNIWAIDRDGLKRAIADALAPASTLRSHADKSAESAEIPERK